MTLAMNGKDYRSILKDHYASRNAKNARYSMRAFARDLGVSSARLSEVLNHNDAFSRKVAERIAARLGFSKHEQEFFCTLVESENGRSTRIRDLAIKKLQKLEVAKDDRLKLDVFELIADWHHFAILEIVGLPQFQSTHKWIAKKLSITEVEATVAVERLVRLGLLIQKNNRWQATDSQTYAQSGIPSAAVRRYHRQVLQKASDAIEFQNVDEREYISAVMSISSKDIPLAKKKMNEFQREFCGAMQCAEQKKDSVYFFNMQFFRAGEKDHD